MHMLIDVFRTHWVIFHPHRPFLLDRYSQYWTRRSTSHVPSAFRFNSGML